MNRARIPAGLTLASICLSAISAAAAGPGSLAQAETLSQQSGRALLAIVGRDS